MIRHPLKPHKAHGFIEGPENQPWFDPVDTGSIINQGRNQASTQKQAEDYPEKEVRHNISGEFRLLPSNLISHQEVSGTESKEIHEAVPAKGQAG